jgi:hypothetical protein
MPQTAEQLREHYEVERELADRLRRASKEERRALYGVVYAERSARIPHHPLVSAAADPEARARSGASSAPATPSWRSAPAMRP